MSARGTKFRCPHCQGKINDVIMISWNGYLLSARARGTCKARRPEAMARAARAGFA
jgi:hypothetical protein